ncbi:MAG: hypothetical protein ACFFCS_14860 [Candidatus Hodarchaeota archaeon]
MAYIKESERQEIIKKVRLTGGITLRNQQVKVHTNGVKFLINRNYVDDGLILEDKNYMLIIVPELNDKYIEETKKKKLEFEFTDSEFIRCLKAIAGYYGMDYDFAWLYGGTGFAFMNCLHYDFLNEGGIHGWKIDRIFPLVANLGLNIRPVGEINKKSPSDDHQRIENAIKDGIDRNIPQLIITKHHSHVIVGYSDFCFYIKPETRLIPKQITAGTWEEFTEEDVISIYSVTEVPAIDDKTIIKAAISAGIDMWENPSAWVEAPFVAGLDVPDVWMNTFKDQGGSWLNHLHKEHMFLYGQITAINRKMRVEFLKQVAEKIPINDEGKEIVESIETSMLKIMSYSAMANWSDISQISKVKESLVEILDAMKKLLGIIK